MGVGILVVTAYMMLRNIERVFNRIWKTPGPRRGVSAFLLYWAMLSMGPFLLGAALLMSTYLLSVKLFDAEFGASALNLILGYLPWLLTASAFTLMYMVVPNCKVAFRNAVTGGVVAAIVFELAKIGFGYFVANSSYTSIYGAFAALPMFLVWIYLSWMIVLAGAGFVRATENFRAEFKKPLPQKMAAVYALWLFWDAQQDGHEGLG
ncbi:MAG: YhjD/YihY/BrkB family envelope integrity protein [Porticoccaceae bacterium]